MRLLYGLYSGSEFIFNLMFVCITLPVVNTETCQQLSMLPAVGYFCIIDCLVGGGGVLLRSHDFYYFITVITVKHKGR